VLDRLVEKGEVEAPLYGNIKIYRVRKRDSAE